MSREQIQTLWGKLAALLDDSLLELPPECWEGGGEEGMDVETAADPVSVNRCVFFGSEFFLKEISHLPSFFNSLFLLETSHSCCARCGICCCNIPQHPARRPLLHRSSADCSHAAWSVKAVPQEGILFLFSSMFNIFHCIPDVLVALPVSESPLQLQILTLCEVWWKKDLKEKEKFALTALLVALKKCFSLKKTVSVLLQQQIIIVGFLVC